jgi:DNA-binding IclR family transcriptional regulator
MAEYMTNTPSTDGQTVKSVGTAFRIIEHLDDQNGGRVTEIATALDLAKSTVHRHLETLSRTGYVVKEGDEYHIGMRFLRLGEAAKTRKRAYAMAGQKVTELATETEERAQFIVEEHGHGRYVYRETGRRAVQTDSGVGKRVEMHASSAGKVILAHLPEAKVHEILELRGLPALTDHTITDVDELFAELDAVRERGYGFNNQENIEGLRAVGVPVIGKGNQVLGALSVSGPIHRLKGEWFEKEIPDLLLGTANELELNIRYS